MSDRYNFVFDALGRHFKGAIGAWLERRNFCARYPLPMKKQSVGLSFYLSLLFGTLWQPDTH